MCIRIIQIALIVFTILPFSYQLEAHNEEKEAITYLGKSYKSDYFNTCLGNIILPALHSSTFGNINKNYSRVPIQEKELIKPQNKVQKASKPNSVLRYLLYAVIILLFVLVFIIYVLSNKNRELIKAHKEVIDASQVMANFYSVISHELRTPLYAVIGITELLIKENPRENQSEFLRALKFSSDHLLALINDVLEINKLDANKTEIAHVSFNLKLLLHNLIDSLSLTKMKKGNSLHLVLDQDIPEYLLGDSLKISQVLINLIGNALKFTTNGNVWVHVSIVSLKEETITIHFNIEDEGIGISKRMQKLIFEDFTQESMQVNKKYGGTGLGLTIVKKIVELLGSEINVESKKHKGANFYFDLTFDKDLIKNQTRKTASDNYKKLSGLNALIVDDDSINQLLTKKILEDKRVYCSICSSGYDAIMQLKINEFDIVFMDINMPKMNGYETAQKIRLFNYTIPILALTASNMGDITEQIKSSGMNGYISKPFVNNAFYQKIIEVL